MCKSQYVGKLHVWWSSALSKIFFLFQFIAAERLIYFWFVPFLSFKLSEHLQRSLCGCYRFLPRCSKMPGRVCVQYSFSWHQYGGNTAHTPVCKICVTKTWGGTNSFILLNEVPSCMPRVHSSIISLYSKWLNICPALFVHRPWENTPVMTWTLLLVIVRGSVDGFQSCLSSPVSSAAAN